MLLSRRVLIRKDGVTCVLSRVHTSPNVSNINLSLIQCGEYDSGLVCLKCVCPLVSYLEKFEPLNPI